MSIKASALACNIIQTPSTVARALEFHRTANQVIKKKIVASSIHLVDFDVGAASEIEPQDVLNRIAFAGFCVFFELVVRAKNRHLLFTKARRFYDLLHRAILYSK